MLAFSGCTHDLSPDEADELRMIRFEMLIVVFLNNQLIFMNPFVERPFFLDANAFYLLILFLTWRENTAHWKIKEIDSSEQRAKGYCPLTPKEVGIFLSALGYPSNTPIYIAAGEIYGGDLHMADLRSRYPILRSKVWTCILMLDFLILRKNVSVLFLKEPCRSVLSNIFGGSVVHFLMLMVSQTSLKGSEITIIITTASFGRYHVHFTCFLFANWKCVQRSALFTVVSIANGNH